MFKIDIKFDPLKKKHANLKQYQAKLKNPTPLIRTLERRVIASNKTNALKGIDKNGNAFAPLRPITLATRRGSGPPLAPGRSTSRIIKNFTCKGSFVAGRIVLKAGWDNMDFMKYHITGYRHRSGRWVPARNANGVRNNLAKTIRKDIKDWYKMDGKTTVDITEFNEA